MKVPEVEMPRGSETYPPEAPGPATPREGSGETSGSAIQPAGWLHRAAIMASRGRPPRPPVLAMTPVMNRPSGVIASAAFEPGRGRSVAVEPEMIQRAAVAPADPAMMAPPLATPFPTVLSPRETILGWAHRVPPRRDIAAA